MKSCPNATCPFALKFKRAGEYQDTASSCSDCGGPLVEGPTAPVAPSRAAAVVVVPSDATSRLVVTIASGLAFIGLSRLPLMGSEGRSSVLLDLVGDDGRPEPRMALAAGLTPFISAFLLVELIALAVPPLRALRTGGPVARRKLDRTAWVLGFLLLLLQLFNIERYRAAVTGENPGSLIWGQLLLAHLAMLGLAFAVTRHGLGNGIALLIGATSLQSLLVSGSTQYRFAQMEMVLSLPSLMILWLMLAAVAWGTMRLGRAGRDGRGALPAAVPFPVSSDGAWALASALMALPVTVGAWLPEASMLARRLQSSHWLYMGILLFLAFDVALAFGYLFFRPRVIGELWVKWVPGVDQTSVVASARALLPVALGISIGATVAMPLVLMQFGSWVGIPTAATLGLLVLSLTCAVVDVADEWSALRRLGPLISVWEVQRTAEIEPIFHLLRTAGIEAHARSFLLRATQQFFGPFIPVGILVPVAREAEARALLASRLPAK